MRALIIATLGCSLTASAFELRVDSQGDVVKWQRDVTFVVDPSIAKLMGEPAALDAITAAVAELEEATPALHVTLVQGAVRGPGYELEGTDNQNEILALADWPYTDDALASTLVTLKSRTNEIVDTDIVFNVEQHTFRVIHDASELRGTTRLDDVQNTVTHELGHALGLMHNMVDEQVVMFPSASAGEVRKRVLQHDDRLGLEALYTEPLPVPVSDLPPPVGCSSTGGVSLALLALLILFVPRGVRAPVKVVAVRRRRLERLTRWTGVFALGLASSAFAQPVAISPIEVGVVRTHVVHRSATSAGLILTSMDVELETCVASSCERVVRVTVPGGRLGALEQYLEHHPVPAIGERLGLATKNGRWVVYRLADESQATRFAALSSGSAKPQAVSPAVPVPSQAIVVPK